MLFRLQSSMIYQREIPIQGRKLVLGTWQQIFDLECDVKPRRRTIQVTVMGES
jgi:thiamine phosphate synthase YjbQ (UPF0047 family)